ncbi:ergothioneine biosynthesis protein EgtC [Haloechinothrix salitolerans]|uniref:Gamma-glutamyl-hercynylcysteine sulfoxide hydrolase n=1 Tax=Haloechinothrix salitolerans TaxID=926830 RepID=A0ABW2C266_9PSEU
MCRHLAYLGPPLCLADPVLDRPHSLLAQSWAPRDMRGGGTVNADGFGVGWYPDDEKEPLRYRQACSIWADPGFDQLARGVTGTALLAAVRSATPGMPVTELACAPFADDGLLFSHNGLIAGWPHSVATIAERLSVVELLTMAAPTDSALLWQLVRARLAEGQDMADAVAGVATEVGEAAPGSRLNLLLTDGRTIVATTWTHALAVRQDPGAVLVASEPLDDDGWTVLPDRSLVVANRDGVDVRPLTKGTA